MRILILSDSHGILDTAKYVAGRLKNEVDFAIHLGDHDEDMELIMEGINVPYATVMGNCDFMDISPKDRLITFNGVNLFLCHGHHYNVKASIMKVYYKGLSENAHVVLFGHSHYPTNTVENGMLILNPGSISLPRGIKYKSYGIVTIENNAVFGKIIAVMDNGLLKPLDRFNKDCTIFC